MPRISGAPCLEIGAENKYIFIMSQRLEMSKEVSGRVCPSIFTAKPRDTAVFINSLPSSFAKSPVNANEADF